MRSGDGDPCLSWLRRQPLGVCRGLRRRFKRNELRADGWTLVDNRLELAETSYRCSDCSYDPADGEDDDELLDVCQSAPRTLSDLRGNRWSPRHALRASDHQMWWSEVPGPLPMVWLARNDSNLRSPDRESGDRFSRFLARLEHETHRFLARFLTESGGLSQTWSGGLGRVT